MTKNVPTKTLIDAFPDWFTGDGIFSEMEDMPWSEDVSADLLDMDYFGNHSGWKKCSPLVYKLFDDDFALSDADREKLADLVVAKFKPNWDALWNTYHLEYDPLSDYDVSETGQDISNFQKAKAFSHMGTRDDVTTDSLTHGHTVSEAANNSSSEDVTFTHGEVIADSDEAHADEQARRYGFNSTDAVPTDEREVDTTNSHVTTHSGNDITDRDISGTESKITTHGGSDSNRKVLDSEDTITENTTDSGSQAGNYTKRFSGLKGYMSRQELITRERELWKESFFNQVYADVDSVLASLIYKREHHVSPYAIIPFGYYAI